MVERVEGTHFRKLFDPTSVGRLELSGRIVMPSPGLHTPGLRHRQVGESRCVRPTALVSVAAPKDHHALQEQVTELHLIGDAREPRKALDAIHEGFEAGMII